MFRRIIPKFKQHPVAAVLFGLYVCMWLYLGYLAYVGITEYKDLMIFGMSTYGAFYFFGPYFLITLLAAIVSKTNGKFYEDLSILILSPIIIAILICVVINWLG